MTLAELEAQRAALADDGALPATTTRDELHAHQQHRARLDRRIARAKQAQATLTELAAPDPLWHARLEAWREVLCSELLALPPRIRDVKLLGLQRNLTLSIRCIDFGPGILKESGYDLTTLKLGQLMRDAGFEPQGADPVANFAGTLPWFGSLRDLSRVEKDVERRRVQAEHQLADALLDDDERAKRDAEAAERVRASNALPQRKTRSDGSQYDKYPDGRRVEVPREEVAD